MLRCFSLLAFLRTSDRYFPFGCLASIVSLVCQNNTLRTSTDIGVYGLFFSLQITLSYSSVTDVGLLALASISCLQSMTVLHLKGLTPSGLSAALLACGGLTKVKLHVSFKSFLPQPLFEHLEARCCVFEWREKEFQVSP